MFYTPRLCKRLSCSFLIFLMLSTLVLIPAAASADTATTLSTITGSAERAYKQGNKLEAVQQLKTAILALWDEVPLQVHDVQLITGADTYEPRGNNAYEKGEPILIKAQLYGYNIKTMNDAYSVGVYTDFYILDEEGEVLAGKDRFMEIKQITPMPVIDFWLNLTYELTGAPSGTFIVKTVVHDLNSDKTTDFNQKIRIK